MRKHERNFPGRPLWLWRWEDDEDKQAGDETPFMSLNAEDVALFYNLMGRIKVDEEHLVCLKEGWS